MRIWRPRNRRGWLLLTAALLIPGSLVVADRIAAGVVGGRLADAVGCVLGLAEPPQVDVNGFPFVTQALAGRFAGLTVTADRFGESDLPIAGVTAEVSDVEIDGDLAAAGAGSTGSGPVEIRIGRLYAALTVDLTRLDALAGNRSDSGTEDRSDGEAADSGGGLLSGADVQIRGSGNGQLIVDLIATSFGQAVPVTVYAVPVLDGRMLRIEPVEVEVFGLRRSADQLAGAVGAGALGERRIERELPELPAGLAYQGLTATADGLRLEITGESVAVGGDELRPAGRATPSGTDKCGESA
ncbi:MULTISPECIES: DUF2993 domain-containing protein [unclassified Solwaraspora]|uniref:LmeA family phospholipid-binding protein n=1 Tax=unclassified Solwaraspora TaxID=2627926 RepID=UPI00248BC544|nr:MULTISPECIES: DUF2993 domain-containing protein [unclassified Solwaraspora]WBB96633.1 DUF2993 domain-containing protein [Solwaraspora sp. WMMA2059]WBC19463.1 DUF2993 domain-containing protein [Solwaraspora sp. WMMA2080]WJK32954.1 DUF2993 domain-containing protein [Solwaraspora sp. WMMA2065]